MEVIPDEFPKNYKDEQEREENWKAFNGIRKLLGCPPNLNYQDAHDWIDAKLQVASRTGSLNW